MENICDAFITYLPSNLSYKGSAGIEEEDNDVEMNSYDGITPEEISNKMRCIVNYLLGSDGTDNLDDLATENNSGTENLSTATTN